MDVDDESIDRLVHIPAIVCKEKKNCLFYSKRQKKEKKHSKKGGYGYKQSVGEVWTVDGIVGGEYGYKRRPTSRSRIK